MVLGADVVARHGAGVLTALGGALAPRGMLLLQEPARALEEPGAGDMVQRAGLQVVARQPAAAGEYVLLRRAPVLPPQHVVIHVPDDDKYEWVPALRDALQRAEKEDMRVYVVSDVKDRWAYYIHYIGR